jgi:hypothetical protein
MGCCFDICTAELSVPTVISKACGEPLAGAHCHEWYRRPFTLSEHSKLWSGVRASSGYSNHEAQKEMPFAQLTDTVAARFLFLFFGFSIFKFMEPARWHSQPFRYSRSCRDSEIRHQHQVTCGLWPLRSQLMVVVQVVGSRISDSNENKKLGMFRMP